MSSQIVQEQTTTLLTPPITLLDEYGNAINPSSLLTLTLTLYDEATATLLNGRNAQNVLNQSGTGVTVATGGVLNWIMSPADNTIIDPYIPVGEHERHIALFRWTWTDGSGVSSGNCDVLLDVERMTPIQPIVVPNI